MHSRELTIDRLALRLFACEMEHLDGVMRLYLAIPGIYKEKAQELREAAQAIGAWKE